MTWLVFLVRMVSDQIGRFIEAPESQNVILKTSRFLLKSLITKNQDNHNIYEKRHSMDTNNKMSDTLESSDSNMLT